MRQVLILAVVFWAASCGGDIPDLGQPASARWSWTCERVVCDGWRHLEFDYDGRAAECDWPCVYWSDADSLRHVKAHFPVAEGCFIEPVLTTGGC